MLTPEVLDELRALHGPLTVVDHDERPACAFRAMTAAEALTLERRLRATPDLSYALAVEACRACLVSDPAGFEAVLDAAPLAFDFEGGLCGKLSAAAVDAAAAETKAGVASWRGAGSQLGRTAQHLLAFKAYQGGPPSADAVAGALAVAEGIDTLRGLFKLHHAFMKALSR